jgi:CRISPR locus-related DNA-binding protein
MRVVLVASIGFKIDFIAKRVADLGRELVKYVIAVGLKTDDEAAWRRVEAAFKLLSSYLSGLGIGSELRSIDSRGALVRKLRDVLAYAYGLAEGNSVVEVFLTGGPRLLGLAFTIAALTLDDEIRRSVRLVAYGEAFESSLVVPVGRLASLLRLDDTSLKVLLELARAGEVDAKTLLTLLGIPRSTLYKKLRELERAGLVERRDGRWSIHPDVVGIL